MIMIIMMGVTIMLMVIIKLMIIKRLMMLVKIVERLVMKGMRVIVMEVGRLMWRCFEAGAGLIFYFRICFCFTSILISLLLYIYSWYKKQATTYIQNIHESTSQLLHLSLLLNQSKTTSLFLLTTIKFNPLNPASITTSPLSLSILFPPTSSSPYHY